MGPATPPAPAPQDLEANDFGSCQSVDDNTVKRKLVSQEEAKRMRIQSPCQLIFDLESMSIKLVEHKLMNRSCLDYTGE